MDAPGTVRQASAAPLFPAGVVQQAAFDDFDAMAAAPRAWDQHYLKLTKGLFRGSLKAAHTADMQIGSVTWSSGVLVTGAVPRGVLSLAIPLVAAGTAHTQGVPVRPNQLVAVADRDELNFTQPAGCELLVLSLGYGLLDLAAATFFGETWRDAVPKAPVLSVQDAGRLAAEFRRLQALASEVDPARLAEPDFGERLEIAAAEAVAAQVAIRQPRRVTSAQRRALARRAHEYLLANETRPVGIAELCVAVGAPERSLHLALREHFGLPPVAYLRVRRLHRARRQLLERGRATTVTATATDWGFDHLGEFATAYRHLFSETPSQTLRRRV
jgi:AraC family ethanolamine operon transcriptional activator